MRLSLLAILSLTGALLAACAPAATGGADGGETAAVVTSRPCFLPQQVANFRDDPTTQSLYLKTDGGETYQLQTSGFCRRLDGALSLAIVPEGGSRVCVGGWARIVINATPETCRAQVVKRLSEDEVAALPSRVRP